MGLWGVLLLITCVSSHAKIYEYRDPLIERSDGKLYMLDWCYVWEQQCGCKPAEEFCKLKGHPYVHSYAYKAKAGDTRNPTAIIGQPEVYCPGDSPGHQCDSYTHVTCSDEFVPDWDKACKPSNKPPCSHTIGGSFPMNSFYSWPPRPEGQGPSRNYSGTPDPAAAPSAAPPLAKPPTVTPPSTPQAPAMLPPLLLPPPSPTVVKPDL